MEKAINPSDLDSQALLEVAYPLCNERIQFKVMDYLASR
jgi:hypothetical protein